MAQTTKLQRIQFDFHPNAVLRLDEIAKETDATSRAEVVRRALALYDRFLESARQGKEFIIRAPDGTEQQILLTEVPIARHQAKASLKAI